MTFPWGSQQAEMGQPWSLGGASTLEDDKQDPCSAVGMDGDTKTVQHCRCIISMEL